MSRNINYDEMYERYKKWYFKQQGVAERQGQGMFSVMYNRKQFRNVYDATKLELKEMVQEGKRGSIGNVYQYMAREQTYGMSQQMYKGLKDLYKEAGEEIKFTRFTTYEEIRAYAPDKIWDTVELYYKQLRADGATSSAAHNMIAQMFFGSD